MDKLPTVHSTFDHTGPPRVRARCPQCEHEDLYDIPLQLHSNVPGDFPVTCGTCEAEFRVDPSSPVNQDAVT